MSSNDELARITTKYVGESGAKVCRSGATTAGSGAGGEDGSEERSTQWT
jgi:hypothetical protein